ncbi:MAG TPA: hypothetical protein VNB94_04015 [Mycobacteriales bacterium]|nr:hypothetical protein [Mycobacteriales bacterium]
MPSYLVETYLTRSVGGERAAAERRARVAVADLASEGLDIRFEHTIHIPEEELCFFVLDAPSGRHAALAAERAGLHPLRVVEAVYTHAPPIEGEP